MGTFNFYEQAIVAAAKNKQTNCFPIVSLEFYSDAFLETKQTCYDSNRLMKLASLNQWQNFNYDLLIKLQEVIIIVTTPQLEIIFASSQMVKMNGYTEVEVLGKTPKLFQGEKTSKTISNEIRVAIQNERAFEKTVLNYKKDGSLYKCHISALPMFNSKGTVSHFIAFEKTV